MSQEEKKQEAGEEAPKKAEKQDKPEKQEKQAKPAKQETPAVEEAKKKRNKKISHLTSKEVEERLKTAEEKMGGLQSLYIRALAARKSELSKAKG